MAMFWKRKRYNVRGNDGRFTVASEGSVNKGTKDIQAVAGAFEAINRLQESQLDMLRARDEAINERVQALLEQRTGENTEEDSTLNTLLMQVIAAIAQKQGQPLAVSPNNPFQPVTETVGDTEPQQTDNKSLNDILGMISKAPAKLFTKNAVERICEQYNINEKDLKGAVQKLNRVYENK